MAPTPLPPTLDYVELAYTFLGFQHRKRFWVNALQDPGGNFIMPNPDTAHANLLFADFWTDILADLVPDMLGTTSVITSMTLFKQQSTPGQFLPIETMGLSVNGTYAGNILWGDQLTVTFRDPDGVFVRDLFMEGAASQYTPGSAQSGATPAFVTAWASSMVNLLVDDLGSYVCSKAGTYGMIYRSWQATLNRKILRERGV